MNNSSKISLFQVLHFQMQDVFACIDVKYIDRILPLLQLERVPSSPPYFVGLMNFAGESIPVIDLAWRLQLERYESYTIDTPIVLCSDGNRRIGYIVDKVIGIVDVDTASIKNDIHKSNSLFLASIAINSILSLLVNVSNILEVDYSILESDSQILTKDKPSD